MKKAKASEKKRRQRANQKEKADKAAAERKTARNEYVIAALFIAVIVALLAFCLATQRNTGDFSQTSSMMNIKQFLSRVEKRPSPINGCGLFAKLPIKNGSYFTPSNKFNVWAKTLLSCRRLPSC